MQNFPGRSVKKQFLVDYHLDPLSRYNGKEFDKMVIYSLNTVMTEILSLSEDTDAKNQQFQIKVVENSVVPECNDTDNLIALVFRLVRALRTVDPLDSVSIQAIDYLKRELSLSVIRLSNGHRQKANTIW